MFYVKKWRVSFRFGLDGSFKQDFGNYVPSSIFENVTVNLVLEDRERVEFRPAKVDFMFLVSHQNENLQDVFPTLFTDIHNWVYYCSKDTFSTMLSSIPSLPQTTATALCIQNSQPYNYLASTVELDGEI